MITARDRVAIGKSGRRANRGCQQASNRMVRRVFRKLPANPDRDTRKDKPGKTKTPGKTVVRRILEKLRGEPDCRRLGVRHANSQAAQRDSG